MKIMLYIRCYPNETTMVMNCDADAMNVDYSYVQRYQTQFLYRQLHKCRPILTFPPVNFLLVKIAICQFIIPGKRMLGLYCVICIDENTRALQL